MNFDNYNRNVDKFIRSVDDVTADVGQELKDTAKRIYTTGMQVYKILLCLELIGILIMTLAGVVEDLVNILYIVPFSLAFIIVAVIEYFLIISTIYRITINMYAKGEMVHYLRAISQQGQLTNVENVPETNDVAESLQHAYVPPVSVDFWLCKACGTQNKKQYGQCKKCGAYRSNETSEEVTMPRAYTMPVVEEKAVPVLVEEPKKREEGKTLAQKIAERVFTQEEKLPEIHLDDTWTCGHCGTANAMKYGQCKKCGKFKNS